MKALPEFSVSDFKMLLLNGKIGKADKFETFFVYTIYGIPAIIFQTWNMVRGQNSRAIGDEIEPHKTRSKQNIAVRRIW